MDRREAVDVGNEISGGKEREPEFPFNIISSQPSCVPHHTSILNGRWWLGRRPGCKLPFVYLEWLVAVGAPREKEGRVAVGNLIVLVWKRAAGRVARVATKTEATSTQKQLPY